MAWDEPIKFNHGVDKMVDTVVQPVNSDGMFGGGTLGAVLLGSLLPRLTGGYGLGAEAAVNATGTNQILQAMNQQQLANSSQLITQDLGRNDRDVLAAASATQTAVASANLQQTVATLQGQTALTKDIMGATITNAAGHTNILGQVAASAADTNANINNARQGIAADISNAVGVIDADLHSMNNQLANAISATRDDINRARFDNLDATHKAEIATLTSAYATQKAINDDGDKTRALISNINTADLNRQITVAENRVAELLGDNRHARSTADIIINNNNNATAVANALAQQQQQQQFSALTGTLHNLLGHVQSINQTVVNTGRMTGNALTPVQV